MSIVWLQVYEKIDWSYELKHAGLRLVPMVALSDSNSKLKLNNYRPKYRRPVSIKEINSLLFLELLVSVLGKSLIIKD